MIRFLLAFGVFFAFGVPAHASFVRSVVEKTDTEPLFDSEYFLDLRSFAWSRAADDAWAASTGGYRVNGASLDCCDLYLDQSLIFTKRLTPGLEFRFRFIELSDKDRSELHHYLELEKDIGAGFSAELFGEPTYRKEDADIGFGIRWRRAGWEARARRTAVDWNLNARGRTTERYSLKPYTNEVSFRAPLGAWHATLAGDADEATRRHIPAENRAFFYRRTRAWASLGKAEGWAPLFRYSYENQVKINSIAPGAATIAEEARRHVHEVLASGRVMLSPDDELEPGAAFMMRDARSDLPATPSSSTFYKRWEMQPYLRWRRSLSARVTTELTPSFSLGENRAIRPGGGTPDLRERVGEAKLQAALELKYSKGFISFGGVLDVDKPGKAWDGGNVRAMFLF